MSTYFVTRHTGALEWACTQGIEAEPVEHLDPADIMSGDIVIGTLPVHVAAEICARGARYLHLVLNIPPDVRGRELSAAEMTYFGARIERYDVQRKEEWR